MIIIHLHSNQGNIEQFDKYIQEGKQIFVLIYMEGCGPCNATRPEWKKIENVLDNKYKNNSNLVVADVEQELLSKIPSLKKQPSGFPTMLYITNKGNTIEDYEESNLKLKDRTIDSFVEWIETKINSNSYGGGFKKIRKTFKKGKKRNAKTSKGKTSKEKKGGKWSLKYKKSINCRKPKGFSQRQHCKYGRKK
jgi:thiol-disulfide isomerase/thioredoxin